MLETEPRSKTEKPKLSPDGKPIVRVMNFRTAFFLRSDLAPFVTTKLPYYPPEEEKEEFAHLLVSRAERNRAWMKQNFPDQNKIKDLSILLENHAKHTNGHMSDGLAFISEIGDPREIRRPYSSETIISRNGQRKVVGKDFVLRYNNSDDSFWGAFWIIADKSLRILRDEQIEKGLKPNPHSPGIIAPIDFHLSVSRPRLFLGWEYEIRLLRSSEESMTLEISSTIPAEVKDVPFYFPEAIEFLTKLQSGEVVLR